MHALSEEEFKGKAEPIFQKIFIKNEDEKPFKPEITKRLFLHFPLGGDWQKTAAWETKLFKAIEQAIKITNDKGFYIACMWDYLESSTSENRYGYILASEFQEALVENKVWEKLNLMDYFWGYTLCSENGYWGMLQTIDDRAFLGGNTKFMQSLHQCFPNIEQEIFKFIQIEQQQGYPYSWQWLTEVFMHIYGEIAMEKVKTLQETKI